MPVTYDQRHAVMTSQHNVRYVSSFNSFGSLSNVSLIAILFISCRRSVFSFVLLDAVVVRLSKSFRIPSCGWGWDVLVVTVGWVGAGVGMSALCALVVLSDEDAGAGGMMAAAMCSGVARTQKGIRQMSCVYIRLLSGSDECV